MAHEFSKPLLAWARNQFDQEIHSDFHRIQQYDGLRAKEHLAVLQRQSPEQLAILARVLPLEVFWDTPDALVRRSQLDVEEREAVEKLRADYNLKCLEGFQQRLQKRWHAMDSPDIKRLFKEVVKDGNRIHQQVGKQKNLEVATAGSGEWGLIIRRNWGHIVMSINLGVGMSLSYRIGLYNAMGEAIRFYDHYLRVLGIGAGDWSVKSKNELNEKFLKAVDFGAWHANEYEVIINHILEGGSI